MSNEQQNTCEAVMACDNGHRDYERDCLMCERERRGELEVVAAALYLGHDDAREQFDMYKAVYLDHPSPPAEPKCERCGETEEHICGFLVDRPPTPEPAESEGELKPCPLCHEPKDLQIDQLPGYKPEIVCNNCGIALQGEDVLDAITRWNKRTKEQANAE